MSRPSPSTPLPVASPAVATAPSHCEAIASAHPADDSPADALDSSVALFARHHYLFALTGILLPAQMWANLEPKSVRYFFVHL